jgi:molybdopterin converting factor small subunit
MAKVTLIGPLKIAAGEGGPLDIEASNIRVLLRVLGEQDAWLAPIAPDSEVQILPPLAGG